MFKRQSIVFVFAAICLHQALEAATPVYKCLSNGSTTFQSDPCPSNVRRKEPNINQLNADRMKKRLEDGNAATAENPTADGPFSVKSEVAPVLPGLGEKNQVKQTAAPAPATLSAFKCDGRKHCSQMTSCKEAKFFLKYCSGVKMDGDGDGIPCEKQWCNGIAD